MTTQKRVLLLSGGLDSAVCLALHKPDVALFVDYGQPHREHERLRAVALAAAHEVPLVSASTHVPFWSFDSRDQTMLVPGRNLILVSLAATLGSPVVIGCNADDYAIYEDCRPEFFAALAPLVVVETPLIAKTKAEIGTLAREAGIADDVTWSCYYPRDGEPCGACDACKGRAVALEPTECGTLNRPCENDPCCGHCEIP